jgi:ribonuclease-3
MNHSLQNTLKRLCQRLDYEFKTQSYLKQALTHCSAGSNNNERFEFLGDSILNMVISHALFTQFPNQSEGQLSRLRAQLVKGDMLAEIAAELSLGDCLYLGQGELKSGGFRRASILADALEAIFAAVFFDGGFDEARRVILNLYESRLQDPLLPDTLKDAKTQLQEYLQGRQLPLPSYTLLKVEGHEHEQQFFICCAVETLNQKTEAEGETRRKAEQMAAKKMLTQLMMIPKPKKPQKYR